MTSYIYDLECMVNLFTATFYDYKNNKWHYFVISHLRNDTIPLLKFLKDPQIHIGYNNDNYDYPLLHHFLNYQSEYLAVITADLDMKKSGDYVARDLYEKSQELITMKFSAVSPKNQFIRQVDLFKIWKFDSAGRFTSLKDLEFNMRLDNIKDMPFDHTHYVNNLEEVKQILIYNKYDVFATYQFFLITLGKTNNPNYKNDDKIQFRFDLKKQYNIDMTNYNDIKIGETILLELYSNFIEKNKWEIKNKSNTPRSIINIKDCLPSFMDFKTKSFDKLINKFKSDVIYNGNFKENSNLKLAYHDCLFTYGNGGAHASIAPGVYNEDKDFMILDVDIDSMYPSILISLNLYPEHLGPEWLYVYKNNIVDVRIKEKLKPKELRDNTIVNAFKFAANGGGYGKTNEEKSWVYDPLVMAKTTIAGQIFISMWVEAMCSVSPDCVFLQVNTDGISVKCRRTDKDKILQISNEICKKAKLSYSTNEYSKMVIRDVNNYIAVKTNGEIKSTGCFNTNPGLEKNHSKLIVPKALNNYFIKGIPIKDTIMNSTNLYDFFIKLKLNAKFNAIFYTNVKGKQIKEKMSKTTRFYVSEGKDTGKLFKYNNNKEKNGSEVTAKFYNTVMNKFIKKDMKDYHINYNYYIRECKKIINTIEEQELDLFANNGY